MSTRLTGDLWEKVASDYLLQQGLTLRHKNYRCPMGEIDLIMQDKDVVVFVEVRFRSDDDYGGSLESITRHKQRKIIRTASCYLLDEKIYDKVFCRLDVIAISLQYGETIIEWIPDAFQ